ncbi:MAG: hypothetical protein JSV03_14505 [Planctomycetota bacterium]|nr:MAG: hypothetical protein JSV03_14505 [Planctomycetota bacterium]
MSLVRATWIIMLILAVPTLPASGGSLFANCEPEDTHHQDAAEPSSSETKDNQDDSSSTLQITPTADIWAGSSTRSLTTGTIAVPAETPPQHVIGARPTSPDAQFFILIETRAPTESVQRCRLVSRYAHAPPHIRHLINTGK